MTNGDDDDNDDDHDNTEEDERAGVVSWVAVLSSIATASFIDVKLEDQLGYVETGRPAKTGPLEYVES